MIRFLVCLGLTILFAAATVFLAWPSAQEPSIPKTTDGRIDAQLAELRREDPEAAARLETDLNALGTPGALVAQAASERSGTSGLLDLARQLDERPQPPWQVELTEMALDPERFQRPEEREEFLIAYGTAMEGLEESGAETLIAPMLDRLRRAETDPTLWDAVHDDPLALGLIDGVLDDPTLRDYYLAEREWLAEIIVQLAWASNGVEMTDGLGDESMDAEPVSPLEIVRKARTYHPLPRRTVVDEDLGPIGFALFLDDGDLIASTVEERGLPLAEVLEVLFVNGAALREAPELVDDRARADYLVRIHDAEPTVWRFARTAPLALQLYRDAPEVADDVLEAYGEDDVAVFLFAAYPEAIATAAEAIDRYGDLAFYVLNKYADLDQDRMTALLNDPEVGSRLIPYLVRFGDGGLDQIERNRSWLNKEFDAQGNPKNDEWWTYVPGGGLADVARNWAQGYPLSGEELGWAALDTADAALLALSFGASQAITAPAKAGLKASVKATGRSQVSKQLLRAGRARNALRATGEAASLRRAGRAASVLQRVAGGLGNVGRFGTRIVNVGGRTVRIAGIGLVRTAKVTRAALRANPARARLVYRALLAGGLAITISQRTLPNLTMIQEGLARFAAEIASGARKLVTDSINDVLQRALGLPQMAWTAPLLSTLILIVLILLTLGAAWSTFRSVIPRRKVRYGSC